MPATSGDVESEPVCGNVAAGTVTTWMTGTVVVGAIVVVGAAVIVSDCVTEGAAM